LPTAVFLYPIFFRTFFCFWAFFDVFYFAEFFSRILGNLPLASFLLSLVLLFYGQFFPSVTFLLWEVCGFSRVSEPVFGRQEPFILSTRRQVVGEEWLEHAVFLLFARFLDFFFSFS